MKKTVVNQWDPGKGNYYPHQLDKEGLKSYDIRYTLHGVKFKGTLREQPHGARYAYRAEITAISPLTGKVITDSKGNVVVRSFWSNEVDLNRLLNAIAKAAEKLYADNAVALSRAVEENVIFRPETTTPAIAAERFAARYEDSLSAKAEKACAMALHLFGGLNTNQIRALTWGDIIFDDCEPDKVIVRLRDDERSGSTHKLDLPIFPMGARILRARYQSLLEDGASKSALRGQKVAVRQNGVVFPASEITRYIVRILKSIELSAEYYSRKEPGKILRPNELLGSTYRYMVHYTCGLGAMEPGTANYLCGKSLTGNTTDDNYTSFSSPEGLERLYAYMHRLCVSEPLPQCIPPQVSEDGSNETDTFFPKMSRDRVTVTATLLLQPGQTLTLESAHGGIGTIEVEESTPSGRRHQSKKGEEADTN